MGTHQIDRLDKKILQLISQDARIPFLEVARECNVSGAAITSVFRNYAIRE
jgi:Lrp/AsnC family transcriptional regulator for asnA, asnC and gidA